MRLRESGMPERSVWESFFDAEQTVRALGLKEATGDVVDLGAGYGTFAIAAARLVSGTVYAIDVCPDMLREVLRLAEMTGLANISTHLRDLTKETSGLVDASVDAVLLFNMLHAERPAVLLDEALRILRPGGLLAVTHWVSDRPTPRGPSLPIRPTPAKCTDWAVGAGFRLVRAVDLPPHHYGLTFERPREATRTNHSV